MKLTKNLIEKLPKDNIITNWEEGSMRVLLEHLEYKSGRQPRFEETIWDKIEAYLVENKIKYCWREPDDVWSGMTVWLPLIHNNDPEKNDNIRKVSDLGKFLFEKLKLGKKCLHFVFEEIAVNGEGKIEGILEELDKVVYEELTGEKLPAKADVKKILRQQSDFFDE